jgi:putative ABC transport system permease protein
VTRFGLLRRSLGQGRLVVVLLALVAGLAAAYVVAVPRHAAVAADEALGDEVAAANVRAREVGLALTPRPVGAPTLAEDPGRGSTPPFDRVDAAVRTVMGSRVESLVGDPTWAAQSEPLLVARSSGEPVSTDQFQVFLRVQSGLDERVRWVAGKAPGQAREERTLSTPTGPRTVRVVPVAVADRTARQWGIEVGDRLDLTPEGADPTAAVVVTGTYEPLDPQDGFWTVEPRLSGVAAIPLPLGGIIQEASLVAAPEAYRAVSDALWRVREGTDDGAGSPALAHTWRYPIDPGRLTAADVEPLRAFLVRLDGDPRIREALPQPLRVTTGLAAILDRYEVAVGTSAVMTSFATAGVTALAVLVLGLTAAVGVSRRSEEIRMMRARGASVFLVATLLAVEVGLVVAPAAALGVVFAHVLVPGATPASAWVEASVVVLLPVVTVVLDGVRRARSLDRSMVADPETATLVRRARRVVLELATVAVAVLAVTTVRSRGPAIASGTTDWYAALAPTLVAVAVSVLVVRTVPPALRRLADRAAHRRGLVGFVGLARAARTGATAVLPVVTVVVGATVLGLLAATSSTVAAQRELAAYRVVGADVRVDALRLDPADLEALSARPGVRAVAPAYSDAGATVRTADGTRRVLLLGIDPESYAEVLRGTPLEAQLSLTDGPAGSLPALSSPDVGAADGAVLVVRRAEVPLEPVETVPGLDRVADGRATPAVIVSLEALQQVLPSARPNTAFVATDASAADALATTPLEEVTPGGLVTDVSSARGAADAVTRLALPALVSTTYLVAAVLVALLSLLAVLLVLAATHDERSTLVARLRTLGLPHGAERALAWTEVLPVVAVAALAGGAVGAVAPWLVAAALDLGPFTGAVSRLTVEPRPVAALVAAAAVVVLGALALLLDALAARRGPLADHLRRGATA